VLLRRCYEPLAKITECESLLWSLVENISRTTFERTPNLESMTSYPDVVWEYSLAMERLATHARLRNWICKPGLADSLLQWSMLGLNLHHRDAYKAICSLISEIAKFPSNGEFTVFPAMERHGQNLVQQIILSMFSQAGTYSRLLRASDVLLSIRSIYKDQFMVWFPATVRTLPIPNNDQTNIISRAANAESPQVFTAVIDDLYSIFHKYQRPS